MFTATADDIHEKLSTILRTDPEATFTIMAASIDVHTRLEVRRVIDILTPLDPMAEWKGHASGPLNDDGWIDPSTAIVEARASLRGTYFAVHGKPCTGWHSGERKGFGPGDIVTYHPVDPTMVTELARRRMNHVMRVMSVDPIWGQKVVVQDEYEGFVDQAMNWHPDEWETTVNRLRRVASGTADETQYSVHMCDGGCGEYAPIQPMTDMVMCDECRRAL